MALSPAAAAEVESDNALDAVLYRAAQRLYAARRAETLKQDGDGSLDVNLTCSNKLCTPVNATNKLHPSFERESGLSQYDLMPSLEAATRRWAHPRAHDGGSEAAEAMPPTGNI